ncbi:MAG TPA: LuxR C-terminal-related transcriptional regulator [Actinomycetota bacterium]|nr:LuxR C-terminal-related transcriptional regulator [Actinomycetota bacterium]
MVARTALVERLLTASGGAVVCVVAPPGYGKTTLLAQWAQRKGGRVGWLTVDPHDNDPAVLLTYLAVALDRVAPLEPETFKILASPSAHVPPAVVPRLAAAMSATTEPVALVLDHVELLDNRQCLDALAQLALQLAGDSQLALASRTQPRLPLGRLRGQGRLMEVGAADLAMDSSEARALLEGAEVRLPGEDAAELHRRTEGWPVGLYLAALALQAAGPTPDTPAAGVAFAGDDRFVVDYLNAELLARLPARQVSFLTRTAVLDRMCGPLCDAVLDTTGSATVLESLAGSNLLLVPLDRRREWYRYHHLFRDLLGAELGRREPELVPELHRRAAAWCEANGLEETAIDHAQAAGDADQVARLVLQVMQPVWASGRVDTVLRWMQWFEREQLMERYPAVAVHGALIFALLGRATKAEQWAAAAERASPEGRLPDGSTMESYLAYLRAILCRDGVATMRRDARLAWDGLSPLSPYRATMLHTEALSLLLAGDPEDADPVFARAFDAATEAAAPPLAAVILAERCSIAAGRDDWAEAAALSDRALELIRGGQFDAYWTSALVYAWAARAALYRGDLNGARDHLARAAGLRPLLTHALPVVSAQALLELAGAYIALGDPDGAHAVLRQADDIFQQRPNLGVLPAQADELRPRLVTMRRTGVGASSLTTAELRLLPLLPSYLTFREIGERLFVSRNTAKTQALSIYRKLGASSRSEAVRHAQQLGLLSQ